VHSLQVGYGVAGSFDARSIAHEVIVPFDRENQRVLGGSPEPYVNNPLRVQAVTEEYRSGQKNKSDWDKLVTVLDRVQAANDESFTQRVLEQVLFEIYRMLASTTVTYPTPNRVSLNGTYQILQQYLSSKSGGDRLEVICTALFRTIGKRFRIFDDVKREKVNVADASSGMSADIECWLKGKLILLVEVKDRTLTLIQLDTKLGTARAKRISEILFIAEQGKEPSDVQNIDSRISGEFASGQNIYVTNFGDFSLAILILFGERGRADLLAEVGMELDRANARIEHRKAWADLLRRA
jgi:hypothetical protein